jgi:molybdate transport system substrate-binding protein
VLLSLATACLPVGRSALTPTSRPAVSGEVTVFAAASLTDAFQEIGAAFEQAQPGTHVTFNFGASSQLRAQLEQGARADVFASADQVQMDAARRAEAILEPERVFATNRLVIVTPRDNPAHIAGVPDLARPGVKLVASQPEVPIGQYTLSLLDRASLDPAFGPDFRQRVEANIVSRESDVRAVVSKVQFGEADAAVVYATDPTPQVRAQLLQIPIPDALNTPASYPIAVARGSNPQAGKSFTEFVLSAAGQQILARWGFLPLPLLA